MTTHDMLRALTYSTNENCKLIAENILSEKSTIEEEKKICGNFLAEVFQGNYIKAFLRADHHNRIAFLFFLLKNNRMREYTELATSIDQLLKIESNAKLN